METMPPVLPAQSVCKTAIVPAGTKIRPLFSIGDRYTLLAFAACPIIIGVESYYRTQLSAHGEICLMGFFSYVYLILVLMAFFRRRKMWNRWKANVQGRTDQNISFTPAGFEISESGGCLTFTPWRLVKSLKIGKGRMSIETAGITVFSVTASYFTPEEIAAVEVFFKTAAKESDT